jgi:hypothetical protein
MKYRGIAACLLLLTLALASAANAQRLETGSVATGKTSDESPASFEFRAGSAGVLTVVVRAEGDTDITLMVTDADGQPLPDGESDQDIGGDTGAEQFAVTIPRAGTYMVKVQTYGWGTASFQIAASWLEFPSLEVPADPDGSPNSATRLAAEQQSMTNSIDGSAGDYWDWYVITADRAGTVTVATRTEEGDLVLEAYEEGEYTESLEYSDQDLQGSSGNEALTLSIAEGQSLYFKVKAFSEGTAIDYRLIVGFIPD